jgi:hypothetical protein
MTAPDVVYVVRPGEKNEELRYSLRSLQNLPHGKVWIAGHCPKWISDEVGRIPVVSRIRGHTHAKASLRAACEHPDVSEQFVYMNDDFFVMQPIEGLPVMHRGSAMEMIQSRRMGSSYIRALEKTRRLLIERGIAEPLMYDLHAPMLVTKAGMLEALDLADSQLLHERTLYGNLHHLGGERRQNHKIRRRDSGWQTWQFLSTNDSGFASLPVGKHIRGAFPSMGPYERTPPAPEVAPPTRPVRKPVRRRSLAASIRRARAGVAA